MSYEVLKNRLTNGDPFLKSAALERITALADNLNISQEQADELTALAEQYGVDVLPDDYPARIEQLEADNKELYEALNMILEGGTDETGTA